MSKAIKGAMQKRPRRATHARACGRGRAHPSGSSPRAIVSVSRGGLRSACARTEIHSPTCRFHQLIAALPLPELTRTVLTGWVAGRPYDRYGPGVRSVGLGEEPNGRGRARKGGVAFLVRRWNYWRLLGFLEKCLATGPGRPPRPSASASTPSGAWSTTAAWSPSAPPAASG